MENTRNNRVVSRSMKALLSAAVVVPLALTAFSTPAQAATGYARCPSGYMCLFAGNSGQGSMGYFKQGAPDLRKFKVAGFKSEWNRSRKEFCAYEAINYNSARCAIFSPGSRKSGISLRFLSIRVA